MVFKYAPEEYINLYPAAFLILSHHAVIHLPAVPESMFPEVFFNCIQEPLLLPEKSRFVFFNMR